MTDVFMVDGDLIDRYEFFDEADLDAASHGLTNCNVRSGTVRPHPADRGVGTNSKSGPEPSTTRYARLTSPSRA